MTAPGTAKALPHRRATRQPAHERREAILQAASRVFARASYRSAGTVQIAREAGVSEPTLYRYFRDKKALYLEVLRRCGDHILKEWGRVAQRSLNPLQTTAAIGAWYTQNVREDPDPLRVRARAAAECQEDDIRAFVRYGYLRAFEFVRDLYAAARRDGLIDREVNPEAAAWLFMSVGHVVDSASLLDMEERLDEGLLQDIARLLARALAPRGGESAGGPPPT